jgi:hypothetical protein
MASRRIKKDWWEELGPDSPLNWNFDRVPNSEIIACCLWEYARESPTIRMKADLHWCHVRHIVHRQEYAQNPALRAQHDEDAARIEARAKREGFDYERFFDEFWKTDFPLMAIYDSVTQHVGDGASAWQGLSRKVRTQLSKQVATSSVLRPLTIATVGELEALWTKNSDDPMEVRLRVRAENDDSEDAALWKDTEPVEPFSAEESAFQNGITAALTVDFSRFTDREIVLAFIAWLAKTRPRRWKRPRRVFPGARQKGRKLIEYRVALERLGLMRLLHWHNPMELREEMPEAWKTICRKEQYFRREIREASKFFRRLFPFVPKSERPQSEERFGIWHPPLERIADEMAQEMGIDRGKK